MASHLRVRAEASLLFGRGMRAGIDRREQKKVGVAVERDVLRKVREAAGIVESSETRRAERERQKAADKWVPPAAGQLAGGGCWATGGCALSPSTAAAWKRRCLLRPCSCSPATFLLPIMLTLCTLTLPVRYDGFDMSFDKHWSEKKREQMTERDWRIFREDFSMAFRGSNTVLPIRNWEEANLPRELSKVGGRGGRRCGVVCCWHGVSCSAVHGSAAAT
jgi:ATP-dependent RNA helicase DDX23/PRP28